RSLALLASWRLRFLLPLILRDFRVADHFQQLPDDVFAGLALGLGLEVGADAVAQDRDGDFLDVIDGNAKTAVHRRHRLAAHDEVLAGTDAAAPVHHLTYKVRRAWIVRIVRPRRA